MLSSISLHIENIDIMNSTAYQGITDKKEFEIIFKEYYERLCRYAEMILKDADSAEEVVQNTFVRLWEKKDKFKAEISLKSYLYKAVYNSALNEVKHKQVRNKYMEIKANETPAYDQVNEHGSGELEKQISKALEKLPEQCRVVFKMSRFQELKYKEIAEILNISVKTVENQMGKALKIMRVQLAEYLVSIVTVIWVLMNG